MSVIISYVSNSILPLVVGYENYTNAWKDIIEIYDSSSKARVLKLCLQLQKLKKGSMKVTEFLKKMKHTASTLAMAGDLVSNSDLLLYIFNGLGLEFNLFSTAITTRSDVSSLSLDEIQGMLLSHEAFFLQLHQSVADITTNLARTNFNNNQ